MTFFPVIKWSGSKRSQSLEIVSHFPDEIETYYECFVGGASVLRFLLSSNKKVKHYICSDINNDLIQLWVAIKKEPLELAKRYEEMWKELNQDADCERKKQYFYKVRERFNNTRKPEDFIFISRVTTNGLIRYNKSGNFNNSFHVTRNGIQPVKLKNLLIDWSRVLNEKDVEFRHCSYDAINPTENDFMYLDPPYFGTKGMYFGCINYEKFWEWLGKQSCSYALSFDGKCGNNDRTYAVPEHLYNQHLYIESGCSSFKRLKLSSVQYVKESLYLKDKNSIIIGRI